MESETFEKNFHDENLDIKKHIIEKLDFISNVSTDEISFSINAENFFEEKNNDFEIPDFLNDKPKIFFKNRTIFPLIPDWYKNLNKCEFDLSNNNESLFN